ncbi:O-methyltransferase [Plantactinospora sp. GCM10030261]|uniref:O-methyltransferase n=1 Tax=Plantactinospora sp. GCM10030261 TaxID=3273420 RepID=UPI003610D9A5
MRSFRHWTPRYVVDRIAIARFQRLDPAAPWLTPRAVEFLDRMLLPDDRGLEFGSGRSTVWLARRIGHLVSVEDDAGWHERVSRQLKELSLDNVDYRFAPRDLPEDRGGDSEYARSVLELPDASLNLVLVDGAYRDHCARYALPKLAPGGLLVIDNVNWFLPSQTRSPFSRGPADGPATPAWAEVLSIIGGWRTVWTSCGVWDTAIYLKP